MKRQRQRKNKNLNDVNSTIARSYPNTTNEPGTGRVMHVAIPERMCGLSGLPGGEGKRKTGDSAPAPADGRLLAPKKCRGRSSRTAERLKWLRMELLCGLSGMTRVSLELQCFNAFCLADSGLSIVEVLDRGSSFKLILYS